jgi:hypothetical protein
MWWPFAANATKATSSAWRTGIQVALAAGPAAAYAPRAPWLHQLLMFLAQ